MIVCVFQLVRGDIGEWQVRERVDIGSGKRGVRQRCYRTRAILWTQIWPVVRHWTLSDCFSSVFVFLLSFSRKTKRSCSFLSPLPLCTTFIHHHPVSIVPFLTVLPFGPNFQVLVQTKGGYFEYVISGEGRRWQRRRWGEHKIQENLNPNSSKTQLQFQ